MRKLLELMESRVTFVEVLVWLIAIVALILLVVLVTSSSSTSNSEGTSQTIINSYNTYNTAPLRTTKPYIVDRVLYRDSYGDSYNDRTYLGHSGSRNRYFDYDDFGNHEKVKGIFGNDISHYSVYVKNREHTGGYFTVKFNFEDYYGRTESHSVRHYVRSHGEQKFLFKEISPNHNEHRNWWYEVASNTKVPTKVYYN